MRPFLWTDPTLVWPGLAPPAVSGSEVSRHLSRRPGGTSCVKHDFLFEDPQSTGFTGLSRMPRSPCVQQKAAAGLRGGNLLRGLGILWFHFHSFRLNESEICNRQLSFRPSRDRQKVHSRYKPVMISSTSTQMHFSNGARLQYQFQVGCGQSCAT